MPSPNLESLLSSYRTGATTSHPATAFTSTNNEGPSPQKAVHKLEELTSPADDTMQGYEKYEKSSKYDTTEEHNNFPMTETKDTQNYLMKNSK